MAQKVYFYDFFPLNCSLFIRFGLEKIKLILAELYVDLNSLKLSLLVY